MIKTVPARAVLSAVAVWSVLAVAAAMASDGGDRVMVLDVEDAAYRALDRSALAREDPASRVRLVVVRDGRPVADRALVRNETLDTLRDEQGELLRREQAVIDEAWVTGDGGAAVIAHRRYTVERPLDGRGQPDLDRFSVRDAEMTVEWVDPQHPDGRWSEELSSGHVLGSVHLMESGSAVAIVITDGERSELHVYSADGGLRAMQRDLIVANPVIREAPDGRTMVIDIAYASRPGLPDRALLVVGLPSAESWTYTWSYGSDQEPVSWNFDAEGALCVTTAAYVFRYAANGTPLASERRR